MTGFWQVNLLQNKGPVAFFSAWVYLRLSILTAFGLRAMHCGGGGQMNGDYKYHPGRLSIATCLVIAPNFSTSNHQLRLNWPPSTFICIPAYYPIPPLASCQWNQFIFIIIGLQWQLTSPLYGWQPIVTMPKCASRPYPFLAHSLHFVAYFLHFLAHCQ